MPKYKFPTHKEILNQIVDPKEHLLNSTELNMLTLKGKEIGKKYGFMVFDRQALMAALRLHILGTTDYTLDQVVDFNKMSKQELRHHINSFFSMMDDTKEGSSLESCAKKLAETHKKAFEKIKNYKFDSVRADNIEYMAKSQPISAVLQSLYIEHSQNMQRLRQGKISDKDDYTAIRQAYNSVYSPEEASRDEDFLGAGVDYFARNINTGCADYLKGNYKSAACHLNFLRNSIKNHAGKTIGELPLTAAGTRRVISSSVSLFRPDLKNDVFEDYANGVSNTFPGLGELPAFEKERETEYAFEGLNSGMKKKLEGFLVNSIDSYSSYFPANYEDDLLKLPKESIKALELAYHNTFGKVYRASEFLAAEALNLKPWDLIYTNGISVKEACGNRYANYSPEEQDLAYRLEVMRHALKEEGVTLKYAEYKRDENDELVAVISDQTYDYKPLVNHYSFNMKASNGVITMESARRFLSSPLQNFTKDPFQAHKPKLREYFSNYFSHQEEILKAHHMDLFDCVFIGEKTLNEIYEEKYAKMCKDLPKSDQEELKMLLVIAEGFNFNRPVFFTDVKQTPEGRIERSIVPITFAGDGIKPVRGMQTEGMEDSIRTKAQSCLNNRAQKYADIEKAEKKEYEAALRSVVKEERNTFGLFFGNRLEAVKRRMEFFQPASRKLFDEITPFMEQMEADVIDACVRYDAYKKAAKLTGNDELRDKFEAEAEKIKTSEPFSTYDDYVTSLECTYGIKEIFKLPLPDKIRLDSLIEEKTGHVVLTWPAMTEEYGTTFYAPTSLTLGPAEDLEGNRTLIREYLDYIYNSRLKPLEEDFDQFILIDGKTAKEIYADKYDLNNPDSFKEYLDEISLTAAEAIKSGKSVDFYISRRRDKEISVDPIHVVSSDHVSLKEATAASYKANQTAGHEKMISNHENHDDKGVAKIIQDRLTVNADSIYNRLKMDEYGSNMKYRNGNITGALMHRYFGRYPEPNTKEFPNPKDGRILMERGTPINYILYRLCEESLNLERQGKPGYTIDQIVSVNALSDRKQYYADELRAICEKNDVKTYAKNLLSCTEATLEYLNKQFPPEKMAAPDANQDEYFMGKPLYLFTNLYDNYQELTANKVVILEEGFATEEEYVEISDAAADYGKLSNANYWLSKKKVQNAYETNVKYEDKSTVLANYCLGEYQQEIISAYIALGKSFHDTGEHLALGVSTNIFELPGLQEIDNLDDKEFCDRLANGTILKDYFIDYDRYNRIQKGIEEGDVNSCIVKVNNEQEKQALRRKALEHTTDYLENEILEMNLSKTAKTREKIFYKGSEKNGYFEKPVYKDVAELSQVDLIIVEEIYDEIFGGINARENVQAYLAGNPGKTEFDLFKIGDKSVHQFLNPDEAPVNRVLTNEEILKRKAEIVRMTMLAEIPLRRELIRRNAQNQFVVAGEEAVFGMTSFDRIKDEHPELESMDSFKTYFKEAYKVIDTKKFTLEDWKDAYTREVNRAAEQLFSDEYQLTDAQFSADAKNGVSPQDIAIKKIESVFGPSPKIINEWCKGRKKVYDRNVFMNNMKGYNKGLFTADEFVTLSYMASMNPKCVKVDVPDYFKNEPNAKQMYLRAHSKEWTSAFLDTKPGPFTAKTFENIINPAKKSVEDAISKFSEDELVYQNDEEIGDVPAYRYKPLADILSYGIKECLRNIKGLDSIQGPDGKFAHFVTMLKKATAMMEGVGNEDLKEAVMESLTDEMKTDLKTVFALKELQDKKAIAEKRINENFMAKQPFLTEEEKQAYLYDIANFDDYAEDWYDAHRKFLDTAQYKNQDKLITDKINNAKKANQEWLVPVYENSKEELKKNIPILTQETKENLLNPEYMAALRENSIHKIDEFKHCVQFLKDQVRDYHAAKFVVDLSDDKSRFIIPIDQLKEKYEKIANADYRFNQARNLILDYVDDKMLENVNSRFRNRVNNPALKITKKDKFASLSAGSASLEAMNIFIEELFTELSKDIYRTGALNQKFMDIKLPSYVLEEGHPEKLVENPKADAINALKDKLQNQLNALQAPPVANNAQPNANAPANANNAQPNANAPANANNAQPNANAPANANNAQPNANAPANANNAQQNANAPVNANNAQQIQKIQQDIALLDEVNKNLAKVKPNVEEYYSQKIKTTDFSACVLDEPNHSKDALRNGEYKDIILEKNPYRNVGSNAKESDEIHYINQDKINALLKLRENPVVASEETNRKILQIANIMNGLGLLAPDGNVPMEEGGKIYGYKKLIDARVKLDEAVDSGNIEEIRTANEEYKMQYKNIQDLHAIIKELFPNPPVVPPNIESGRNHLIPVEFTSDVNTDSIMNSIYLLANQCIKTGVSVQDYLKNPVTATEKSVENMIEKNGFDAKCASFKNVSEAFNHYADMMDSSYCIKEIFSDPRVFYGVIRPIESLYHLEDNKELRDDLTRQSLIISDLAEMRGEQETALAGTISKFIKDGDSMGEEANKRFREGIKTALISGGKLEKKYLPVIDTYDNGVEKPDTVNYEEALAVPNGYRSIIAMYKANESDALQNSYMGKLLEESLFDYLKAHPEDMEKQEYKELEKVALDAGFYLDVKTTQASEYQTFKNQYNQKSLQMANAVKSEEAEFNKDIVKIQKDLKKALKDQRNLNNRGRDTVEIDASVKKLENKLNNAIDKRLILLNNEYALGKVTPSYLKARHQQLSDLKADPSNTDYLKIPEFVSKNGALAAADAKIISDNVTGRLFSGHVKNLDSFKEWKMHEEATEWDNMGNEKPRIEYENQLSAEEWQKEYEKEIIKSAQIKMPAGVTKTAVIARNVQKRKEEFEKSILSEKTILAHRVANRGNIPSVTMENTAQTLADRKTDIRNRFHDGQAKNQYTSVAEDHHLPQNINFNQPDEDVRALFTINDPMNEAFYHDVAEIIALGIAENRGGKLPEGNLEMFTAQIMRDMEFRKIMMPLSDKIAEELNKDYQPGEQRQTYWSDQLLSMLDDRTIVKAYVKQKEAVKKNDMAADGMFMIQEAVNGAEAERAAAIAHNQPGLQQHQPGPQQNQVGAHQPNPVGQNGPQQNQPGPLHNQPEPQQGANHQPAHQPHPVNGMRPI